MGIVVRRHRKTIRPGAHHRQEIAGAGTRNLTVLGKEVAAFTDRPDNIGDDCLRLALGYGPDGLIRAVKRRTDKVVHAAVGETEFFFFGVFWVGGMGKAWGG